MARLLGEQYKAAVIRMDQAILNHWEQRIEHADRSERLRSVYSRTLETARAIPIDRTTAVTYFKNSVATEWEEIRRAYPDDVRKQIREEIIGATNIDPRAMYLEAQEKAVKILKIGRIHTSTQYRAIQDFMDALGTDDGELQQQCQDMLDNFEACLMRKKARQPSD